MFDREVRHWSQHTHFAWLRRLPSMGPRISGRSKNQHGSFPTTMSLHISTSVQLALPVQDSVCLVRGVMLHLYSPENGRLNGALSEEATGFCLCDFHDVPCSQTYFGLWVQQKKTRGGGGGGGGGNFADVTQLAFQMNLEIT